ncbi:MAG: hypothetical protein ACREKM_01170 [Longimicrobiales bacterium]
MTTGRSSSKSAAGGKQHARDVPAVQWLVAGVALLVVVASFGLVLYEGIAGDDRPPLLAVVVDSIVQDSAGYRVHVTVRNGGGRAAAEVRVHAELTTGDLGGSGDVPDAGDVPEAANVPDAGDVPAIESGVIRFDLLPPGARASGVFVFASDPRTGRLRARVVGHVVP